MDYLKLPVSEDKRDELEEQFYWEAEALNEEGWRLMDGALAEGEPPGFRPDLDRALIRVKVACIADVMRDANLITIPEMSILGDVVEMCKRRGKYDQYTIIQFLAEVRDSHGDYWKKIGKGIMEGKDPRNRCRCGKLSKMFRPGVGHACCPEHYGEE